MYGSLALYKQKKCFVFIGDPTKIDKVGVNVVKKRAHKGAFLWYTIGISNVHRVSTRKSASGLYHFSKGVKRRERMLAATALIHLYHWDL
jgi:hypothetical protein